MRSSEIKIYNISDCLNSQCFTNKRNISIQNKKYIYKKVHGDDKNEDTIYENPFVDDMVKKDLSFGELNS